MRTCVLALSFTLLALSNPAGASAQAAASPKPPGGGVPDLSVNWIRGGPITFSEWEFTEEAKRKFAAYERAVLLREAVLPDGTRLNPDMRERGNTP